MAVAVPLESDSDERFFLSAIFVGPFVPSERDAAR